MMKMATELLAVSILCYVSLSGYSLFFNIL